MLSPKQSGGIWVDIQFIPFSVLLSGGRDRVFFDTLQGKVSMAASSQLLFLHVLERKICAADDHQHSHHLPERPADNGHALQPAEEALGSPKLPEQSGHSFFL